MTRELHRTLTSTSAAFFRDALAILDNDSFDRFNRERTLDLQAVQIAIDWQANENEKIARMFHKTEKKRGETIAEWEAKFLSHINDLFENVAQDTASWPVPLEWGKHFPVNPPKSTQPALSPPNEKTMKEGTFENALAWSDYNLQRLAQHRMVLIMCSAIVQEAHSLTHTTALIAKAQQWVRLKTAQQNAIRSELILLEGDPAKIQALREEILAQVTPENHSLGHYFSHLNNGGNSSSASETRFRTQALRHVQAGFDPSIGGADAPSGMSYSDLGLG